MRKFLNVAAVAAMAAVTFANPAPLLADHHESATDPALTAALGSEVRGDDGTRDEYRNPAETLTFFGVKPGMTVVDYMPAGGWYSRIIIPYLGEGGTYIALNPELHPELTGYWDMYRGTAEKFPTEAREWVPSGRRSLFAAALPAAFRWNKALIALYARLTGRGKPHKAALIACARKLLIYANTVVQRQTPWTEKTATT
jgi:predicted methyltransferase